MSVLLIATMAQKNIGQSSKCFSPIHRKFNNDSKIFDQILNAMTKGPGIWAKLFKQIECCDSTQNCIFKQIIKKKHFLHQRLCTAYVIWGPLKTTICCLCNNSHRMARNNSAWVGWLLIKL